MDKHEQNPFHLGEFLIKRKLEAGPQMDTRGRTCCKFRNQHLEFCCSFCWPQFYTKFWRQTLQSKCQLGFWLEQSFSKPFLTPCIKYVIQNLMAVVWLKGILLALQLKHTSTNIHMNAGTSCIFLGKRIIKCRLTSLLHLGWTAVLILRAWRGTDDEMAANTQLWPHAGALYWDVLVVFDHMVAFVGLPCWRLR